MRIKRDGIGRRESATTESAGGTTTAGGSGGKKPPLVLFKKSMVTNTHNTRYQDSKHSEPESRVPTAHQRSISTSELVMCEGLKQEEGALGTARMEGEGAEGGANSPKGRSKQLFPMMLRKEFVDLNVSSSVGEPRESHEWEGVLEGEDPF